MTDLELLSLAAKAIGYRKAELIRDNPTIELYSDGTRVFQWNPLENDGDALRLAVDLRLEIYVGNLGDALSEWDGVGVEVITPDCSRVREPIGDNPYRPTRRAIVRAAAKIGAAKAGEE